jgi:transcriptional regulator with XRE-family HTH domain
MDNDAPTLGSLIRSLRTQNGWTLQAMSDKTGIPRSTLAKVEYGRLTLGYDKLMQISKRLNIRMSELFASGDDLAGRVMTRRSVGTKDSALRIETPNYEYFFLCPDLRKKRMIPIFGRVRAKSVEEFGELIRHPGEEFIYVLTGRVAVHTEFYETVVLEPGQCAYIDSSMGHAYILAPGCDEASLLAGCTSSDDELLDVLRAPEQPDSSGPSSKTAHIASSKSPKKARRTKKPLASRPRKA